MDSIAHAEIVHVIIEAVIIAVAHECRRTCHGIVVIVIAESHAGLTVIGLVGLFIVCGIAQQYAVFMVSEGAVRDSHIVRRSLEIEELIPVVRAERGSLYLVVSPEVDMVYPEVPAVCELPDVIGVQLGVVSEVEIAYYHIIPGTVIFIIGAEVHIIELMRTVAADDGLVRLEVDVVVTAVVALSVVVAGAYLVF